MSRGYVEICKTRFKFTPSERKIEIKFERSSVDDWIIALQSTNREVCVTINHNTCCTNFIFVYDSRSRLQMWISGTLRKMT